MDHASIKGVSRTGTTDTTQFEISAVDGKGRFGGGDVIADSTGLHIATGNSNMIHFGTYGSEAVFIQNYSGSLRLGGTQSSTVAVVGSLIPGVAQGTGGSFLGKATSADTGFRGVYLWDSSSGTPKLLTYSTSNSRLEFDGNQVGGTGGGGTVNSGAAGFLAYYDSAGTTLDDWPYMQYTGGKVRMHDDFDMQSYGIYFKETGGGTDLIRLRAPASASAYTFSLPPDGGSSGFVLRTNGSGTTTWVEQTGTTYSGGTGIDLSGTTFYTANAELSTVTESTGFYFAGNDSGTNTRRIAIGNIDLSDFNNDAGFSTSSGTVTSVAAGSGLDFSTITSTGSVTLGTPGTLTGSTSNAVTTTSHTHAVTGLEYDDGVFYIQTESGSGSKYSVSTHSTSNVTVQLLGSTYIDVTNSGAVTTVTYTGGTGNGDITNVLAGNGMTGGASSGEATITLGTPGTLTSSTSNAVTGVSHTHAVTGLGGGSDPLRLGYGLVGTPSYSFSSDTDTGMFYNQVGSNTLAFACG